jgi:prepilin-type N-terminal cleavage/methylation domain-containing protein
MNDPRNNRRRDGYTLIELMLALTIFAFASTAISSLLYSTYRVNRHVQTATECGSQVEISIRRMIEVVRSATNVLLEPNKLYVQTPPDPSGRSYIYMYYLDTTGADPKLRPQLRERIANAGTLAVIQDVAMVDSISAFSVTEVTPAGEHPAYIIDIAAGKGQTIARNCTITCRNLDGTTKADPAKPNP